MSAPLRSAELRAITTIDAEALRALGYGFHRDLRDDGEDATHALKPGNTAALCGLPNYDHARHEYSLSHNGEHPALTCPTCCKRAARILSQHAKRKRREGDRFDPSNKPGSCLWCGWKLKKHNDAGARGVRGTGYFCTGTCAEEFAHAAARTGFRFKPRSKKP